VKRVLSTAPPHKAITGVDNGFGGPLAFITFRLSSAMFFGRVSLFIGSLARLRLIEREKGEDGLQEETWRRHVDGAVPSRPNNDWA